MGNFKDRTGEENVNKQGLKMKIIKYTTRKDVDIEFEDGYIATKKHYESFSTGRIINPNYTKKNRETEENINSQGVSMKILEYRSASDIDVQFEDGYIARNRDYGEFKRGSILNPNYPNSRVRDKVGEINTMNNGEICKIIKYNNSKDITVKFLRTGEIVSGKTYQWFKEGNIRGKTIPSVLGVGIVGNNVATDGNNKCVAYEKWSGMLARCFDIKLKNKHPTYKDVICCDVWTYYENFKKWHDENYYEIEGEKMCLDKDILIKGNKIYSPDTCVYVPERINTLFIQSSSSRGKLPVGVVKVGKYYNWQLSKKGKNGEQLRERGYGFETPEEAFYAYKKAKEGYIKEVADEYKDKIPQKLYDAMYKWKVEITD